MSNEDLDLIKAEHSLRQELHDQRVAQTEKIAVNSRFAMERSHKARDDGNRYIMLGAGGGIGLMAYQVLTASGWAQIIAVLSVVSFALALRFGFATFQALMVEEAKLSSEWEKYAVKVYRVLVEDEEEFLQTGQHPGSDWPDVPSHEFTEFSKTSSWAVFFLNLGAVWALIYLLLGVEWSQIGETLKTVTSNPLSS